MPFETLESFTKKNAPPTAKISYLMPTIREGKRQKPDAQPSLKIWLPTTICGVSKSETFVMQLGSGPDAGKLRIVGTDSMRTKPEGAITPRQLAHSFGFTFGYVPRLGDSTFEADAAVKKISDEVFELSVPESWFEVERA